MRHLCTMPIFGLIRRGVNRLIFQLCGTDFVIINRLVIIQLLKCRAFLWFGETGIKKPFITHPAYIREFGPFDLIGQNFASRGIEHLNRAPVGPPILNRISEQRTILRRYPAIQRCCAILCPAIRIKQHAVSARQPFTHIQNRLVLQPVILVKKIIAACLFRQTKALIIE